jgi:N-acetylmuramoyl-L-alanine amidase
VNASVPLFAEARHGVIAVTPSHVHRVAVTSTAGQPINPTAFARGACMAFLPTSPSRHRTVFLDAGHGGRDPGAIGSTRSGQTILEARATLSVELDTMARLRAGGFRVVVSRIGDSSVARLRPNDVSGGVLTVDGSHQDVLARARCADEAHADVLVGIYFNAGVPGGAGSVTGYDAVRPYAAQNLRLARLLQTDALSAMNARGWEIPDDGVRSDGGLGSVLSAQGTAYGHLVLLGAADPGYVSTPSQMPGAVIEPLFITDPFDGSIAASRRGQTVIADGLARAIEQYFAPAR